MDDSLLAGAKTIINQWLALKPDENLLIIHDSKYAPEAEALSFFANQAQAKSRLFPFQNPNDYRNDLREIFSGADAAIGLTDYSLLTTPMVLKAVSKGLRYLSFPPVTLDGRSILAYDFIQEDLTWSKEMAQRIRSHLLIGEKIHVTTQAGTSLRLGYRDREPHFLNGQCQNPHDVASSSFEIYVPIEEDKTEGVIVLDGAMGQIGALKQPLRLVYEHGKIVSIGEGEDGDRLRNYIASFRDDRMFSASEFGIGLNRLAHCLGRCYVEDESALTTCHFGHGRNLALGGLLDAEGHYDLVILKPTIIVAGSVIMQDGQLKV